MPLTFFLYKTLSLSILRESFDHDIWFLCWCVHPWAGDVISFHITHQILMRPAANNLCQSQQRRKWHISLRTIACHHNYGATVPDIFCDITHLFNCVSHFTRVSFTQYTVYGFGALVDDNKQNGSFSFL